MSLLAARCLQFLVGLRHSAEVKVGDEKNADEDDHAHDESETVGEHAFCRQPLVVRPIAADKNTLLTHCTL